MQFKKIALALAVTFAVPSAFADNLSTGVPTENIIYITGATAQTKSIALSIARLCGASNTLIELTDGQAVPTGKGWKCNTSASTTYVSLPGVTGPFVILKNEGGSLNGINPLRDGSTQTQLDITNCTVTGTTGTCSNSLVAKISHIGVSDVSEKIYSARNQLNTNTSGNTYTKDISLGQQQGFGIVVSPSLYTALQTDQSTSGIPSISKAQMASLMTQTTGYWDILLPNTNSKPTDPLTLQRRSTSSGTQASAELFFLNNPCSKGSVGGSATATTGANTTTGTSYESGKFFVRQHSTTDGVLSGVSSGYALGVVSLENIQPASSWKFVAIEGVHPGTANSPEWQKKNILNGSYPFAYEAFLFKNTKSTLGTTLLGNISDVVSGFVADLGVGENLASSNGLVGDPNAATADYGSNTARFSRSGNECAPSTYSF